MDSSVFNERRRIGILEGSSSMKKSHFDLPQKFVSRVGELHKIKRDVARYKESKRASETAKVQAESELSRAKKTVKELAMQIEESNSRVKAQMKGIETLKKSSTLETKVKHDESSGYENVIKELEFMKRKLSKLKLDMARVREEKMWAEKEIESSNAKMKSSLSIKEALRKNIEETNEEQVLVELAQIEALKELAEIEADRSKKASEFSVAMDKKEKKIMDATREIELSKELESKLAVTLSDVNVLQSAMESTNNFENNSENAEELKSMNEELEAAKLQMESVKKEGFQLMASMDIIRNELKHVKKETLQLKKTELKTDLTVQNLNSKFLRAKSKLEAVKAAEEKANSILSNLLLTFEQLKTEAEVAKKETKLASEEKANIKEEIQKAETETELSEEKLQAALQELEVVKSSEALAFDKLQVLIENTMTTRASSLKDCPTITISKFEHEYLTGRADRAEQIADKKVAAAQAWIEAIKASEKEQLLKIKTMQREIKEMRVEEEKEVYRTAKQLSAKRVVEGELKNMIDKHKKSNNFQNWQLATLLNKSMKGNGSLTPSKSAKFRKSTSPAQRATPRSSPFVIRKRKKVVPNLTKIFNGRKRSYKAQ